VSDSYSYLLPSIICSTDSITAGAGLSISGDTVTIILDETRNGTYECRVDAGPFTPCMLFNCINIIAVH